MANQKIIERIEKLFSLSKSANEHEAQSALLKAQELLAKHKLSMADIELGNKSIEEVVHDVVAVNLRSCGWKLSLANVIADNLSCYAWGIGSSYITFLGNESDVDICKITFDFAVRYIEERCQTIKKELKKRKVSVRGVSNNYSVGFIMGLRDQYERQKQENQQWGLVLTKPEKAVEIFNAKKFKTKQCKYQSYPEYQNIGYKDGEKFSMSVLQNS